MSAPKTIEDIIASKNSKEKTLQLRSLLLAGLIIISSLIWLALSTQAIRKQRRENEQLLVQKDSLLREVANLKFAIDTLSLVSRQEVEVTLMDLKHLAAFDRLSVCLVGEYLSLKENHPKFVEEAFDTKEYTDVYEYNSPSAMIHVLKTCNAIKDNIKTKSELMKITNATAYKPGQMIINGSIFFYKTGYVMLYVGGFRDIKEFCIGMTPLGILALKPNFAQIEMVGTLNAN